jgi:hypothetical protein
MRSFIIYYGDQIKENEMSSAGGMHQEIRNAYKILAPVPEGKRPLGSPRCRWENKTKMDLSEIGYDGVDWIKVAQMVPLAGSCENCNEPSGLTNGRKFSFSM